MSVSAFIFSILGSIILNGAFRQIPKLLSSIISQFFDFTHCMVFDFIFYCVTVHTLYPVPFRSLPKGNTGSGNEIAVFLLRPRHTLRHIAATSRLVCTAAATRLLALSLSLRSLAHIQTGLNSCDRSQRQNSDAATMIFTCHTRRLVTATCRGDVSQRFVASCVSEFMFELCARSLPFSND